MTVKSRVCCTSLIEARIVWVRSDRIDTWIAGGIEASSSGSMALTRSTVPMTLASGSRWTARMIARFPLYQPACWSFSGPETAWPMSRTRTGAPFW